MVVFLDNFVFMRGGCHGRRDIRRASFGCARHCRRFVGSGGVGVFFCAVSFDGIFGRRRKYYRSRRRFYKKGACAAKEKRFVAHDGENRLCCAVFRASYRVGECYGVRVT